jgi:excinuclease UvrABC nuclease subunit
MDADALGCFRKRNSLVVYLIFLRHGRVIGGRALSFEATEEFSEKDRYKRHKDAVEYIYLPGKKEAVVLEQSSAEQLLLMRLRDEAHRFAVTYQQKLLLKKTMASRLDRIPGIGEKRRKSLLRRFGSVKRISAASIDDLAQTGGIGQQTARKILFFLKKENQPSELRKSIKLKAGK